MADTLRQAAIAVQQYVFAALFGLAHYSYIAAITVHEVNKFLAYIS